MWGYSCDSEDDLRYTFTFKLRLPESEVSLRCFYLHLSLILFGSSFVHHLSPIRTAFFYGSTFGLELSAFGAAKVTSITALMATADLKGAEYREAFGEAAWSQILGTYSMLLGSCHWLVEGSRKFNSK